MTAAILQNTIGTGVGYSRGRYKVDLAYQVQLPATESVGHSSLKSGEYDNSRVEVAVHSVTLTNQIRVLKIISQRRREPAPLRLGFSGAA